MDDFLIGRHSPYWGTAVEALNVKLRNGKVQIAWLNGMGALRRVSLVEIHEIARARVGNKAVFDMTYRIAMRKAMETDNGN